MLLKRASRALGLNIGKFSYPSYIISKGLGRKSGIPYYQRGFIMRLSLITKADPKTKIVAEFKIPVTIELATCRLLCDDIPDWMQKFEDQEDTFALNRWGWLLRLSVESPSMALREWGTQVMKNWFVVMGDRKDHPAWESYTTSERIVNALLFFHVLRGFNCKLEDCYDAIERILMNMGAHLLKHIEFRGKLTNNHVLNNARALYILGRLSSCTAFADTGRSIFIHETPKMITTSGFLREGSSHYHLLVLRTYLEVFWAAQFTGDDVFAEKLEPVIKSMIKAAWFFNVYSSRKQAFDIPFVGDLSPDFPPEWVKDICISEPALKLYKPCEGHRYSDTGWNGIWEENESSINKSLHEVPHFGRRQQFHSDSGWYRVDIGDLTVFWHVDPCGSAPVHSHGHSDTGSFILYWKGVQVITDPGRLGYMAEPLNLYGKAAQAHNTFTIDGFGPFPVMKYLYPENYGERTASVSWETEDEGYRFKILHDGFRRIDKGFNSAREFHIRGDSMEINDFIGGTGVHHVKTFFHFGKGIELRNHSLESREITFNTGEGKAYLRYRVDGEYRAEVISGQHLPEPVGWYFPQYGKSISVSTLLIESKTDFPYKAHFSMSFTE